MYIDACTYFPYVIGSEKRLNFMENTKAWPTTTQMYQKPWDVYRHPSSSTKSNTRKCSYLLTWNGVAPKWGISLAIFDRVWYSQLPHPYQICEGRKIFSTCRVMIEELPYLVSRLLLLQPWSYGNWKQKFSHCARPFSQIVSHMFI